MLVKFKFTRQEFLEYIMSGFPIKVTNVSLLYDGIRNYINNNDFNLFASHMGNHLIIAGYDPEDPNSAEEDLIKVTYDRLKQKVVMKSIKIDAQIENGQSEEEIEPNPIIGDAYLRVIVFCKQIIKLRREAFNLSKENTKSLCEFEDKFSNNIVGLSKSNMSNNQKYDPWPL